MHFRCPHCMNAIDVVEDDDWWEVTCPSCGTHISVAGDQETRTRMSVQEQLAHFELLERIGVGHFGAVWRARDTVLDRIVALKVSREQVDARPSRWSFLREARAASQLNHPNIVPIYEIGQAKGHTFIVSEYIEGLDLRRHLKRAGKLAPRQAAQIARDIARALHHAHEEGILHRDVKSGNILLDADMRPYLADFGLAKRNGAEVTVTRDGEILGTPAYMAPEQAAGRNSEVDARSDIYSLGAVLYEMLTGQLVFRGGEQTLVYRVIHEEPRSPRSVARDVPEDLSTICLTCLEKDPDDRYQTAEQLGRDLDRFLCGESIEARPPSVLERAWRWCRREPYKTIAAVATTVAFFLLGVAVWAAARIDREDLTVLPPWATDRVSVVVKSRPTGAQLLFVPLHPDTFEEHPEFRLGPFASGTTVELPAGLFYLVIAYRDHRTFHEVYRYVPRPGERPRFVNSPVTLFRKLGDGTYRLSDIELFRQSDVAAEMVRVAGGTARVELLSSAMQKQSVPDFFIDGRRLPSAWRRHMKSRCRGRLPGIGTPTWPIRCTLRRCRWQASVGLKRPGTRNVSESDCPILESISTCRLCERPREENGRMTTCRAVSARSTIRPLT